MAEPRHSKERILEMLTDTDSVGALFAQAVRGGWRDYMERYSPEDRLTHSKRSRAGLVYDHAAARLRGLAEGPLSKRLRILPYRGLVVAILDDELALKIPKKLSRQLLSRNAPTQQALDFLDQGGPAQQCLAFLKERTALIVGYVLDALELEIAGVYLTCPDGPRHNHFQARLDTGEAAGIGPRGEGLPDVPAFGGERHELGQEKGGGES